MALIIISMYVPQFIRLYPTLFPMKIFGMYIIVVILIIFSLLYICAVGSDVEFVESPLSYYYLIPETIVLIPCWVRQQQEDTDSQKTLSATFYRNSTPINVEDPPFSHFLSVDSFENVIGLGIVYSSAYHSTTYQCEAGGLWSGTVAVFVGGM